MDSGKDVFNGLDIDICRGAITAIMGPSGTGKTTLLKLITGQVMADRGQVVVDGQDLRELNRKQVYALRRRMGMLFQNGALLTDLDVFENVAFPLREHTRLPERLIRTIVLTSCTPSGCAARRTCCRSSCPGAWPAAWRWRAPSPWTRTS